MQRILDGYPSIIDRALLYVPDYIRNNVHVHFFCGTDPYYAGLESGDDKVGDGRSYRDTAHHCGIQAQALPKSLRHPTIVLPEPPFLFDPYDILHEYGHEIDSLICKNLIYDFHPITRYAKTNIHEAFAEAFAFWALKEDIFHYWHIEDDEERLRTFALIYEEFDDVFANAFKDGALYC